MGYRTQFIVLNGIKQNINLREILLEDDAVAMEGVTVSASGQISHSDRKLIFPSERQMKISTNGVNLLQQMMLPRIQINPMNNEIGVLGRELSFVSMERKQKLKRLRHYSHQTLFV